MRRLTRGCGRFCWREVWPAAPHVGHSTVEGVPAMRAHKSVGKQKHWRATASDTWDPDVSAGSLLDARREPEREERVGPGRGTFGPCSRFPFSFFSFSFLFCFTLFVFLIQIFKFKSLS